MNYVHITFNKPTPKYVKLEIFIAICIMFVYNFLFIKRSIYIQYIHNCIYTIYT